MSVGRRGEGRVALEVVGALLITAVVHAVIVGVLWFAESDTAYLSLPAHFRAITPAPARARGRHGEVGFERRRIETDCSSIPECEPQLEPVVIEVKVARLGMAEQLKDKLPEIQKYEVPEKEELSVNVEKEPAKVAPRKLKDFLKKKAQLDKRRRRRPKRVRKLFNLDDDPRARPTRFEKIVGRMDGDVYGKGVDTEKFDTYFGRLSYELHKQFNPPVSLSRKVIVRQLVRVLITGLNADGTIRSYRMKRAAKVKGFTMAAEAALRAFMVSEGGVHRFPPPPPDILAFVNKKGVLVDLDGRLFQP